VFKLFSQSCYNICINYSPHELNFGFGDVSPGDSVEVRSLEPASSNNMEFGSLTECIANYLPCTDGTTLCALRSCFAYSNAENVQGSVVNTMLDVKPYASYGIHNATALINDISRPPMINSRVVMLPTDMYDELFVTGSDAAYIKFKSDGYDFDQIEEFYIDLSRINGSITFDKNYYEEFSWNSATDELFVKVQLYQLPNGDYFYKNYLLIKPQDDHIDDSTEIIGYADIIHQSLLNGGNSSNDVIDQGNIMETLMDRITNVMDNQQRMTSATPNTINEATVEGQGGGELLTPTDTTELREISAGLATSVKLLATIDEIREELLKRKAELRTREGKSKKEILAARRQAETERAKARAIQAKREQDRLREGEAQLLIQLKTETERERKLITEQLAAISKAKNEAFLMREAMERERERLEIEVIDSEYKLQQERLAQLDRDLAELMVETDAKRSRMKSTLRDMNRTRLRAKIAAGLKGDEMSDKFLVPPVPTTTTTTTTTSTLDAISSVNSMSLDNISQWLNSVRETPVDPIAAVVHRKEYDVAEMDRKALVNLFDNLLDVRSFRNP